jgi:hypothetical protein
MANDDEEIIFKNENKWHVVVFDPTITGYATDLIKQYFPNDCKYMYNQN